MMESAELGELEVSLVLEAIFRRYGYDFRGYARDVMGRRLSIAQRKLGVSSLGELQHGLLVDEGVFQVVLSQLTVRVSEFFRDPEFWIALRHKVVPILRTYPTLKLWLAGCASGEEAYSMAIVLEEEGLADRSIIYATDLSSEGLAEAKEGVYAQSRLATFSSNYRSAGGKRQFEDYCTVAYDRLAMDSSLRRNVVFFEHNLISDYSPGQMNVVFCRNVLIYFDASARRQTLELLRGCLSPCGYLCLGMSEALAPGLRGDFDVIAKHERIFRAGAT
jgi:chemotaxis protein methyltransferase CheR